MSTVKFGQVVLVTRSQAPKINRNNVPRGLAGVMIRNFMFKKTGESDWLETPETSQKLDQFVDDSFKANSAARDSAITRIDLAPAQRLLLSGPDYDEYTEGLGALRRQGRVTFENAKHQQLLQKLLDRAIRVDLDDPNHLQPRDIFKPKP